MTAEQKATIEKIVELAKQDDKILGVLLCGSLADQTATAKSDVDVMVIFDDESFSQISATKEYFWGTDFDNKQRKGLVLENEFFWFFNMKPCAFL